MVRGMFVTHTFQRNSGASRWTREVTGIATPKDTGSGSRIDVPERGSKYRRAASSHHLEAVLECVRVVRLGIISERSHFTEKYAGSKAGNVDLVANTCVHHCSRAFDSRALQRSLL